MQIVTVQFDYPNRPKYSLLLEVFKESVRLYMPKVKFLAIKTKAPVNKTGRPLNFNYNDFKLALWVDFLDHTKDNVIFADCDMMAIQSAEHAFNIPFDVAYTARTVVKRIPMNGGIMMARPTDAAKRFFREMLDVNTKMLKNEKYHNQWRIRYAGMNQSAFGCVFETGKHKAKVHAYKTIEWNAVDCDWHRLAEKTVFVHYKSKLRKQILAGNKPNSNYTKPMVLWYTMRDRMIRERRRR